jgi:hypothetical protein
MWAMIPILRTLDRSVLMSTAMWNLSEFVRT